MGFIFRFAMWAQSERRQSKQLPMKNRSWTRLPPQQQCKEKMGLE